MPTIKIRNSQTATNTPPSLVQGELAINEQDQLLFYRDGVGAVQSFDLTTLSGISDVVSDTTPQLGGNLDINGFDIVSTANADIDIFPNGTGNVNIGNFSFDADQTVGVGQDNYVLTYDDGTGLISLEASAGGGGGGATVGRHPIYHIQHTEAAGVDGGTFTSGAWQTRTLNTEAISQISGASLSTNQVTLPAGRYRIRASAVAYDVQLHKLKLRNITDATDTLIGENSHSNDTNNVTHSARLVGEFVIAGTKTFELQHRCGVSRATNGFGIATNFAVSEVYVNLLIEKVDEIIDLANIGLDDLSDVDTTTTAPTDGQALIWDNGSSTWIPGDVAAGGGAVADYTSTPLTIAQAAGGTLPHGLAGIPELVTVTLVCQNPELGYAAGEELLWGLNDISSTANNEWGLAVSSDATNIYYRYADTTEVFYGLNKTTGFRAQLTAANWRVVIRAWETLGGGAAAGGGGGIIESTEQIAAGGEANFDFTDVPADCKRIVVSFYDSNASDTSHDLLLQLKGSGAFETTGYESQSGVMRNGVSSATTRRTDAFHIERDGGTDSVSGQFILTRMNGSGDKWVMSTSYQGRDLNSYAGAGGGHKTITGALTELRLSPSIGTFSAGSSFNVQYEAGSAAAGGGGIDPFSERFLHIQDQKSSGTGAQVASVGANIRDLNTALTNEITGASLAANQITLPAGDYYIDAIASHDSSSTGTRHRAYIYDTTGAATLLTGTTEFTDAASSDGGITYSKVSGRITLSTTSVLELRHYSNINGSMGRAATSGDPEMYADIKIWKVDEAGGGAGGGSSTESLLLAVSDETTALTTGTNKLTFRMPYAFTLTDIRASVSTAPTGGVLTVDVNESGTSILSTKLTIDSGEKTSTTAATPAVISDSALADDAEITIDIDGVNGSPTGLKVTLIGTQA